MCTLKFKKAVHSLNVLVQYAPSSLKCHGFTGIGGDRLFTYHRLDRFSNLLVVEFGFVVDSGYLHFLAYWSIFKIFLFWGYDLQSIESLSPCTTSSPLTRRRATHLEVVSTVEGKVIVLTSKKRLERACFTLFLVVVYWSRKN